MADGKPMFDSEEEMKLIFLKEAQSLLDGTEAAFIAVDEGDHSAELIDKIFRLAHNFKSSAKTVGLQALSDFGHVFEDVLTKIKNGTLFPNRHVCTVLLKTLDHFKIYVAGLKADMAFVHDTTEIIETLKNLKQADTGSAVTAEIEISTSAAAANAADETPAVNLATSPPAKTFAPLSPAFFKNNEVGSKYE
jgi:chemotaxis protein histidine kinase CheA